MRRALPLCLMALVLCGFGAGPFWGENKGPAATGGFALSDFDSSCQSSVPAETSATCSYDAGTGAGRGLVVTVCGVQTSDRAIHESTQMTYGGVQMTQIAVFSTSASSGRPFGALYYLDNPAAGTNDIVINWYLGRETLAWVMSAARLSGHAATQSGPTSTQETVLTSWDVTISGQDPGDIVYHASCTRGGDGTRGPLTSNPLTIQTHGLTDGGTSTQDGRVTIATGAGTVSTNTYTAQKSTYYADGMWAIQPE